MATTKKTVNQEQNSNKSKNARPIIKRNRVTVLRVWYSLIEKSKEDPSLLDRMLDLTDNSTFKLTSAKPDVLADIKGIIKVGDKIFYRVPASPGPKGMFSALLSVFDLFDAQRVWANKVKNTKDREKWRESADARRQFEAVELLTGQKITAQQEEILYKKYLRERGLEEAPTATETEDTEE